MLLHRTNGGVWVRFRVGEVVEGDRKCVEGGETKD